METGPLKSMDAATVTIEVKLPSAELVKTFSEIVDHVEKCKFFHAHPELAAIFNAVHFPKPAETKPS